MTQFGLELKILRLSFLKTGSTALCLHGLSLIIGFVFKCILSHPQTLHPSVIPTHPEEHVDQ